MTMKMTITNIIKRKSNMLYFPESLKIKFNVSPATLHHYSTEVSNFLKNKPFYNLPPPEVAVSLKILFV